MAQNKKENINVPAVEEPKAEAPAQKGIFCKTCEREHPATFDGPGIGHWRFEVGSDAETMFDHLCNERKFKLFIPLDSGEKFGAVATPQMNGLKVGIYKGAYIDVPKSLAELMMDSLNQTQRLTHEVTVRNPQTGHIQPARLDLRSDRDQALLSE